MSFSTRSFVAFSLCTLCLTGVTACGGGGGGGGGGGSTTSGNTGQIVDALVEGLHYSSGSLSGLTDANGHFEYEAGGQVTFSVGDIVLGTVDGSSILSIVDFDLDAETYDDFTKVTNIARCLQTIDEDSEPTNGIKISAATRAAAAGQAINFDQDTEDWDSDPEVLETLGLLTDNPDFTQNNLVDAEEAAEHGNAWLAASRAGEYSGTWTTSNGSASGPLALSVSTTGVVTLIASNEDGDIGFSSSEDGTDVEGNGEFWVTDWEAYQFSGQITGTEVQGTWFDSSTETGGTFSAELSINPLTFLDNDYIENFAFLQNTTFVGDIYSYDDEDDPVGTFHLHITGDSYGRYSVQLFAFLPDFEIASFYATAMDASTLSFRGLCTSGEGFSGDLVVGGGGASVDGIYYNLNGEPGGTFSAGLE